LNYAAMFGRRYWRSSRRVGSKGGDRAGLAALPCPTIPPDSATKTSC
jgi:hypothetical protein